MEYTKLGNTSLEISRIGFGAWAIGGHGYGNLDDDQSIKAIHKALDIGINLFDTADVYGFGHSETLLAKALGKQKNNVIIATKFGIVYDKSGKIWKDCSPKRILEALEGSLKRMKLECIPLYQIHWPDSKTKICDTMDMLIKCQEMGKIKHIGCSNFSEKQTAELCSLGRLETAQSEYSLIKSKNNSYIKYCREKFQLSTIIYGALGRGLLTGKYDKQSTFGENDTRNQDPDFYGDTLIKHLKTVKRLKILANKYNKSPAQIATRWVLQNPYTTSVLIGIKNSTQALSTAGSVDWQMEKEDVKSLSGK